MENDKTFSLAEWHSFLPMQEKARQMFWANKYLGIISSMGTGKSRWLRHIALEAALYYHAKYGIKGVKVAICSEDFPSLQARQISVIKQEYPDFIGHYIESRHVFELHPEYGGGQIYFLNMDDPSRYDSVEFAVILYEEAQKLKKSDFTTMRRRLRWPGVGDDVHFSCVYNPPRASEDSWARDIFNDRIFHPDEAEKEKFAAMPFNVKENLANLPPGYENQFKGMSREEYDGYWLGLPHAFDNMLDDTGFRPLLTGVQVADRTVKKSLPRTGTSVIGIDPGGGGDETCMVIRDDAGAEMVFNEKTRDTLVAIPYLLDIVKGEMGRVTDVCIDKTGLGWNFYTRVKEVFSRHENEDVNKIRVHGVGFGEKSRQPARYKNMKAELFLKAQEWVLKEGFLKHDDAEPWKQLTQARYKVQSDGKFTEMEKKEDMLARGIASGNAADSFAISFFPVKKNDWTKRPFVDKSAKIWEDQAV